MSYRLTTLEKAKCHFLWTKKKMDTLQITEQLKRQRGDEVLIWRYLYQRREHDLKIKEAVGL